MTAADTPIDVHSAVAEAAAEIAHARKDMLRIATAGSVDDGKSTLIGRLLYDSKAVFEDQYAAIERASRGDYVDLALLTDGLRAEREQGITIDVAYRYFTTPKRTFILADTPGHVQYTRNMVTGASTADLAIVLVDARKGMVEQSRRHAFLASLLQVPHLVVAVNKMDLVDWSEDVYEGIRDEFAAFAAKLDVPDLTVVPISALQGDNVVTRSPHMPWYAGPSLLHHLENVHVASDRNLVDTRFPVQYVIRPQSDAFHDYRGYAGRGGAGGRRGPGAAQRPDDDGRRDRRARRPPRAGVPADVGHGAARRRPRRVPGRPDLPAEERAAGDPGPRRDGVLDVRHPAGAADAAGGQAHHPHGARRGQAAAVPAQHQHAAPGTRRAGPAAQRHRAAAPAHHPAVVRRRLPPQPGHRPVHPDRRGDQRHRRRRDADPAPLTRYPGRDAARDAVLAPSGCRTASRQ
jgi:small GTP-binding protein